MAMSIFAELQSGITTTSEEETHRVARDLAHALPPECTLALSGDLGAGKTTFVRGLARAWAVRDPVTSPSYTLCNLYRGDRLLVHVDAYRLSTPDAWESLMIEDFLRAPWCIAVEWPEHVVPALPLDALWLRFEIATGGNRTITSGASG